MRLNINQKVALLLNLFEFAKAVYPENEPLPPMLLGRARALSDWLAANAATSTAESQRLVEEENLPPPGPGEQYGFVSVGKLELGDAITQLMEAVVSAELTIDRIPDSPAPPRKVVNGQLRTFRPRHGGRTRR